jgi:hypothetical protein
LLYWIGTEIQKDKNRDDLTLIEKRTLHLGHNLAAFMRAVGLNPRGGGKRGDAKRLHNQADRLFSSRIGWVEKPQQGSAHGIFRTSVEFSPHYELWWDVRSPEQGAFWESKVLLGEILYSAFASSSVPLDMRALRALKRSPLALDLYAMLAYRAFVILQKNLTPQFIAWEQLRCQFGTDYSDPKNFKKKAAAALRKIATVYPGLTITKAKGGFAIHATRLAVPQKASA